MASVFVAAVAAAIVSGPGTGRVLEVTMHPLISPSSVVVGPVGSINLALMAHGVEAWPDLMGSELRNPPAFLELLPLTIPQWQLPVGVYVKFTCPDTPAVVDVCDAWVFFYTCSHSCVTKYQGGIPGLLSVTPGWMRNQCAPRFVTGAPGASFEHPMGAFRRQLARGQSTIITVPGAEKAEFVAFGIDAAGVDCAQHTTPGACPTSTGKCKWDAVNSECRATDCKGGRGPAPMCPECPWLGLDTRPLSDGPFGAVP